MVCHCACALAYTCIVSTLDMCVLAICVSSYADVCVSYACICVTYTGVWDKYLSHIAYLTHIQAYSDVCWRMLTYADVCWRMLTYADVCCICVSHITYLTHIQAYICDMCVSYACICVSNFYIYLSLCYYMCPHPICISVLILLYMCPHMCPDTIYMDMCMYIYIYIYIYMQSRKHLLAQFTCFTSWCCTTQFTCCTSVLILYLLVFTCFTSLLALLVSWYYIY
jgi:hypothetical protein